MSIETETAVPTECGLVPLTAAQYHAMKDRIGHSMMNVYREEPAEFHGRYVLRSRPEPEPTPEMQLGTLFHLYRLEQSIFDKTVFRLPDICSDGTEWNWRRPSHRDERDAIQAAAKAEGKIQIDSEMMNLILAMSDALSRHGDAARLLDHAERTESAVVWTDDESGMQCKALRDIVGRIGSTRYIADIKTSEDVGILAFSRKCATMKYHCQAAHYWEGTHAADGPRVGAFYWIAVQSVWPFNVAVYPIHPDDLELGFRRNQETLHAIARSHCENDWAADYAKGVISGFRIARFAHYEEETIGEDE